MSWVPPHLDSLVGLKTAKAKELLFGYLDEDQSDLYRRHGFFYVRARNKKYYALCDGTRAFLIDPDTGRPTAVRTFWALDNSGWKLPREDMLVAQLLCLTASSYWEGVACTQVCRYLGHHPLQTGKYFKRSVPSWPAVDGLFGA